MSPTRCLVAGWGKNEFSSSGKYEMILKEIDLPLVDSNVCERQLRATRLGRRFRLNKSSFVCAGGEQGKDSCTGDGGSPLVCLVNENWYLAGLVAWGIVVTSQTSCENGLESCCPPEGYNCGMKYPPIDGSNEPATVILAPGDTYQGSGVIIDHLHILTIAHRVSSFVSNPTQLNVRLGEWDASSNGVLEPQEYNINRIFIHPQYQTSNLVNDIAILRTSEAINLGSIPTIATVCLPSTSVTNIRCMVSGWGRNDFSSTGTYQAIKKEVDLPLLNPSTCQNQLRATRLGANYNLDSNSFVCAGGERGKDACTGDGGSPLSCLIAGNWYVIGLVSWGIGCGRQNVPGLYGSYPWQAVILDPKGEVYIGSGALINNRNVITAAHKINSLQNKRLKVRLGEWDASSPSEPIPSQEFTVIKIFIHPQFSELTLQNDIAILRLSKQVEIGSSPVIGTICLTLNPVTNMRCFVAGWGKNDFESGSYQAIMKEVDVPIIDPYTCQVQLRETRLGQKFVLDTKSFVCAGGEFGKDACTGDGGSPLVCNLNNRWYLVGLVAWGIGCGQYNVPGVYVNVPNFISWIEKIMKLKT
ncbi:CLUMA_CG011524, isoform A [Clunio marinus]|uniref:CLUMA_CG011524, isoform A n=1 Tax=Clunio marinus TaxID=568069 RepID=A0A1J1ICZ5_9DIPT|nr:CLUMA_CG011524, isoform A [Clunio marinus]